MASVFLIAQDNSFLFRICPNFDAPSSEGNYQIDARPDNIITVKQNHIEKIAAVYSTQRETQHALRLVEEFISYWQDRRPADKTVPAFQFPQPIQKIDVLGLLRRFNFERPNYCNHCAAFRNPFNALP